MKKSIIIFFLILVSHYTHAQYEVVEPSQPDKSYYMNILDIGKFTSIDKSEYGNTYDYVNSKWDCYGLRLDYSKFESSHYKKEITKEEFDSLVSTENKTIISFEFIEELFKGEKRMCYKNQELLQSRHFFLRIKEGNKYFEYKVNPIVVRAVVLD